MTEREKYSLGFKNLLLKRAYILDNSNRFIPVPEYLAYFTKKFGFKYTYIIPPAYYRLEVLDRYKDQIVYTSHLSNAQGGNQLFSLVQVNPATHIYFSYYYLEDEFYVGAEIYTAEPGFVQDFLEKYSEFEFYGQKTKETFGFGAATNKAN